MPVEPRPASSVLLLRPGAATPIECYLIRRAPGMRFLGGYYAFPGGKVDLADRRPEALARTAGLAAADAAARLGDPDADVPPLAYWLAAVRELFEETGVLLALDSSGRPLDVHAAGLHDRLEGDRQALVRGDRSFTALLAANGWTADLSRLTCFSHFITPPTSPIRFSARFFFCPLPAGQSPRLIVEETTEGLWVSPALAHARYRTGEWPMAEPAEYGMQYLTQFASLEALWQHHADGRPTLQGIIHRVPTSPRDAVDRPVVTAPRG